VDRDNTHRKSLFSRRIELGKDSMNISKMYEDSVDSIKKTYNDTQLNPFKYPEKIKVELVINYKESLKTLDIEQLKKIFKLVKKEVNKELK
jgi:hypothetical protein